MYAKTKNERQIYTILLSFCAVYAYACHSRGIVMVIASAMTVLLIPFLQRKGKEGFRISVSLAVWQSFL